MTRLKLKKLFSSKNGVARALAQWLGDPQHPRIWIMDTDDQWIVGSKGAGDMYAIEIGEDILGWVGGADAPAVAALVAAMAAEQEQQIALAGEVLDKYREINLLYHLTGKLGAAMELTQIAQIALEESTRLIRATGGEILLRTEPDAEARAATCGLFPPHAAEPGARIAQRVLDSGKGEIANAESGLPASFLVAPLQANERPLGAILLVSEARAGFSAADLKLLNTVASQAAPQIEHALAYEKALRDAREREEQLKKQIEALQIQIDESRTAKQVAEITETDYFQNLRAKAERLRYGKE